MGFVDTLKEFVGFGDVNDFEEDCEMEDTHAAPAPQKKNKVVPLHGQSTEPKIVSLKPKCFSNSRAVSDELKKRRKRVMDVGAVDPEEQRIVVHFIAGPV